VVEAAALSRARIRRGLLAVWLVLAMLVAVIVVIEHGARGRAKSGADTADGRMLLPLPLEELGAIEIADAGRLHRFERDPNGRWFYHGVHTGAEGAHTHVADPALAERIDRSLAAFGRTRIERDFPVGGHGADYGVATPDVVILVYRPNESQPLAQYAVGHVAPDTVSRYMMVVGRPVVVTIPNYQIDNLLGLIASVGGASGAAPGGRR
jgi:hypothetical protein